MPTENKNPELHNLNDFNDTLINIKDNTKENSRTDHFPLHSTPLLCSLPVAVPGIDPLPPHHLLHFHEIMNETQRAMHLPKR